ncbi:hypothetical protein V1514DRAFT_324525 [Lipomyces japonicus]|uniref:uncharacterized protein n=1 Tax=Lipomyces japonicus TaxID=56871 RepID=UPI0034CD40C4
MSNINSDKKSKSYENSSLPSPVSLKRLKDRFTTPSKRVIRSPLTIINNNNNTALFDSDAFDYHRRAASIGNNDSTTKLSLLRDNNNNNVEEHITWKVSPHPSSEGDVQDNGQHLDHDTSPLAKIITSSGLATELSSASVDPAIELLEKYFEKDEITTNSVGNLNEIRSEVVVNVTRAATCEPEWPRLTRKRPLLSQQNIAFSKSESTESDRKGRTESVLAESSGLKIHNHQYNSESDEFLFDDDDLDLQLLEETENHLLQKEPSGIKQVVPNEIHVAKAITPNLQNLQTENKTKDAVANDEDLFNDDDDDFAVDEEDINAIISDLEKKSQQNLVSDQELIRSGDNDQRNSDCKRLIVKEIHCVDGQDVKWIIANEENHDNSRAVTTTPTKVALKGEWCNTTVDVNDILHIIGNYITISKGIYELDNTHGLVVVNPDQLITTTTISRYFFCPRSAFLESRVKESFDLNKSMLYGRIIHELFQRAMLQNNFVSNFLDNIVNSLLPSYIEELFFLNIPLGIAKAYIIERYPIIQKWAKSFTRLKTNNSQIQQNDSRYKNSQDQSHDLVSINKVLDCEENIWSPKYGIKGNVDMTVLADFNKRQGCIVPFEIKTGRQTGSLVHHAQTIIYTLILTEHYDIEVIYGILFYLEHGTTLSINSTVNEIRGLLIARNEIAKSSNAHKITAPMLKSLRNCKQCNSANSCLIYHKVAENGTSKSSGLESWFDARTAHIKQQHREFFLHWDKLLQSEERCITGFRQEIWLLNGEDREMKGRCVANLKVNYFYEISSVNNDQRFEYSFTRANSVQLNLNDSQISIGDPIIVSEMNGRIACASGYVIYIGQKALTVSVNRQFHDSNATENAKDVIYRLDKDEFTIGMKTVRGNLVDMLSADSSSRRRDLIIDLALPEFSNPVKITDLDRTLNSDQVTAVTKVLSASDYALIMGMPGTGKTTTTVQIMKVLLEQGKSILLASYTHTAVDNILLKLKKSCNSILRLGSINKIHPEIRQFALKKDSLPNDFTKLHDMYFETKVVATTALGINSVLLRKRHFDYCIIDEASQITLPVCLGPLRFASKFVLVGDHNQLSPLVKSKEAKSNGLEVSLFRLLSESHASAVVVLKHQYRMCKEIMCLSNELIYENRLQCGSAEIANRTLSVPNKHEGLKQLHSSTGPCVQPCWVTDLLDDRIKVSFVDTDEIPGRESIAGGRLQNIVEAQLITTLTGTLVDCGVPEKDIGVISIYRGQLSLLSTTLGRWPKIELQTVDKFQGRDKECVIVSLVRSNDDRDVGDLLTDWRRLNVSLTRARSKLIIFGSRTTLRQVKMLEKFFQIVETKGWVYKAAPNAHVIHSAVGSLTSGHRNKENEVSKNNRRVSVVRKGTALQKQPVLRDIANAL